MSRRGIGSCSWQQQRWVCLFGALVLAGCSEPLREPPSISAAAPSATEVEPASTTAIPTAAERAALAVLDSFMQAFNARDVDATEATFLFPHVRLASGTVTVLERAGERPDLFDGFQAANPEWERSGWLQRDVISSSPNKVHFDTEFARFREDGSEIARYRSIYVVERSLGTDEDEPRWGIRARSSFAP